jgi:hypothetical protein
MSKQLLSRTPMEQALVDIMSKMESQDGKYVDHEPLSDGTQAVGRYAIKPTTAQEMLNRMPSSEFSNTKDRFEMQEKLEQSPELQEDIVGKLAKHLLQKNQGQLDPSAMGYFKGHNRSFDRNKEDIEKLNLYKDRLDAVKEELGIMPTLYNKLKEPR